MDQKLSKAAQDALKNAYVPYSDFPVAAALRLADGRIITGVNVENASYGLSNCAERTALFSAYAEGYRKSDIVEVVVTTKNESLVSPCGACRQVMNELVPADALVHMVDATGDVKTLANHELLPYAFSEEELPE